MCSAALSEDGALLAFKETGGEYSHAENLTLFIQDVCNSAGRKPEEIQAVAVSKGPGSYTGLRIGVSVAKGFCYARGIPLIGINTLQALEKALPHNGEGLRCPMLDARRMEVYCAVYDEKGRELHPAAAKIIEAGSFSELLEKQKVFFFGDGAVKCKSILDHPNATFIEDILPSARHMIALSDQAFRERRFEDVAYFEPAYLKEFYTGK